MGEFLGKAFVVLLAAAGILFTAFTLYLMFVWAPVVMYAEAECLELGYPENRVTIGLERYCTNLEGTVTFKVDKQSK